MRKYIITFAVGLVIAVMVFAEKDLLGQTDAKEAIRILSDGFLLSGVLITGMGLLIYVSNDGFFDIFSYGVKSFLLVFQRDPLKRRMDKSFYDYRIENLEHKHGFRHIVIVGIVFLLLAVIFTVVFKIKS